jgi:pyruvate dehydrogenase E2 component (dihydrolipoamide acetyltransferase)
VGPGATVPVGSTIAIIADPDEDISAIAGPGGAPPATAAAPAATAAAREPARPAAAPPSAQPAAAATVATAPSPSAADVRRAPAQAPAAAAASVAAAPVPETEERPVAGQRLRASPLAKKLAQRAGIDLAVVRGTGPGGRIIQRDVEAASAARPAPVAAVPAASVAAAARPEGEFEDQALSQIRAAIARQMVQSKAPVPHFYITTEIAMDRAAALREELQALPGAPKVTVTDLVVRASALTLLKHPGVNASFQGQAIRRHRAVHVGLAVALDDGLITPVLRDCDRKPLFQIATETRDLVERTRARKLKGQELSGATFSVSNLGMFPVDEFSAIINPPEGAILAVGAILEKAVVVDGQLAVGKRMRVTLSCDHRVMDGAMAARFLADLKALLEAPLGLLV